MNEQSLQRTVTEYLWLLPKPPEGPFWSAVNPISAKSKAVAGLSKALGMRAGVPDFILCWQGRFIGIELKAGRGRLSKVQQDIKTEITTAGGIYHECRSLTDLMNLLAMLGIEGPMVSA